MHVETVQPHGLIQYAVPIVIAALVLGLRVRRMRQMRPLKLERLWIVPVLYLVLVAVIFFQKPPSPTGWLVCAIALVIGAALGWQRGKTMEIHVDPATHELNQRASIAGVAFLVILIGVKMAAQQGGNTFHFNVGMLTDALAALALGMFSLTRLEMYLRGKAMLEQARAAR